MKATTTRGPDAILWEPAEPCGTGVLVLGGSSGRIERDRARLLAQHGALAESIRWFGGAGQHSGPWEIPVEQFQHQVVRLRRDCDRVAIEQATIRVERIGVVVLVSGGDDRVWPAVDAGRRIARRRGGAGLPADATVETTHPQAGHRAVLPGETVPRGGVRMGRGGTPEADAELGRVAWSHISKALQLHTHDSLAVAPDE